MNTGVLRAIGAYLLWGLLPLYWKLLASLPALEILSHRVAWSFACFAIYFLRRDEWTWIRGVMGSWRQLGVTLLTSALISFNWGIYIWAVNAGLIVEASLGYFINPLVSVALGVWVLGERLRFWQWVSAGMATVGVLYLTFSYGQFPWVALSLALSFGLYGLLKKRTSLNVTQGMLMETAWVFVPAVAFLFWGSLTAGNSAFGSSFEMTSLLVLSGALTAVPLLLFASAAKGIPLSTLGLLQYLAPTLQFLIGVFVYHETFGRDRLIGFSIIWVSLVVFTWERIAFGRYGKTRVVSG